MFDAAGGGGGAVVVVVVGGGGGGAVVVVVVGGGGRRRRRGRWRGRRGRRRRRSSSSSSAPGTRRGATAGSRRRRATTDATLSWFSCALRAAAQTATRAQTAFCNSRRGAPNNVPQMTAATPRRLPPVLWFRRAPPFSGDTVHPRRHTGGEGFLENLDNQTRATQTGNPSETFCALFSQVTDPAVRDI